MHPELQMEPYQVRWETLVQRIPDKLQPAPGFHVCSVVIPFLCLVKHTMTMDRHPVFMQSLDQFRHLLAYAPIRIYHIFHTLTNQLVVSNYIIGIKQDYHLTVLFIDSPKFRNKGPIPNRSAARSSMHETSRKPIIMSKRPISTHNIVVVRAATKEAGFEKDPEIQRIQVSHKFIVSYSEGFWTVVLAILIYFDEKSMFTIKQQIFFSIQLFNAFEKYLRNGERITARKKPTRKLFTRTNFMSKAKYYFNSDAIIDDFLVKRKGAFFQNYTFPLYKMFHSCSFSGCVST